MTSPITTPDFGTAIDEYVAVAEKLREANRRAILGIAGPPAAGKSTFARALVERLQATSEPSSVSLLPMDGYHHYNAFLDERGWRNIKGAPQTFDVDAYVTLLGNVRNQPEETWYAPGFSRVTDEPVIDEHCIHPETRLVVTEGNYLLLDGPWAAVRPLCDELWFLDIDPEVQRARLVKRQSEENGRSLTEAEEFVDRSDMANAHIIRTQSTQADRYVVLSESL